MKGAWSGKDPGRRQIDEARALRNRKYDRMKLPAMKNATEEKKQKAMEEMMRERPE